jgi:hypothetical protein
MVSTPSRLNTRPIRPQSTGPRPFPAAILLLTTPAMTANPQTAMNSDPSITLPFVTQYAPADHEHPASLGSPLIFLRPDGQETSSVG